MNIDFPVYYHPTSAGHGYIGPRIVYHARPINDTDRIVALEARIAVLEDRLARLELA